MKTFWNTLLVLSLGTYAHADVLILPEGQGGSLTVGANEVVTVSAYQQSPDPAPYLTQIVANGSTNTLALAALHDDFVNTPATFAGPLQIIFKDSGSHLVSYKKTAGHTAQSAVLTMDHPTAISVPNGKTIKFSSLVPPPDEDMTVNVTVQKGTNAFDAVKLHPGTEFSGPVDIVLTVTDAPADDDGFQMAAVYSYYFNDTSASP